jgi:hypothetical protein
MNELSPDLKPHLNNVESIQKTILIDLKRLSTSFGTIHDFLSAFWVTNKSQNSDQDPFIKWVSNNCLEIQTVWYFLLYNFESKDVPSNSSLQDRYLEVCSSGLLFQSFDQLFQRLIQNLDHGNVSIRNKALKSIQEVTMLNKESLLTESVILQLKQLLLDQSASVRESAVDFLGKLMIDEKHLNAFYPLISQRILV